MNSTHSDVLASSTSWSGRIFNGEWIAAEGGTLEVIEPGSGKPLHHTGHANVADVAVAVAQARVAQRQWADLPPRERAAVFHRAGHLLQQQAAVAAALIARETGGILPKGEHEVREAILLFQQAAAMPLQAQGQLLPSVSGRMSLARRLPLGVVAVISPFNFPLILSLRSVAPALAVGNAVILKPDSRTPYAGGFLIAEILQLAGLPKGLLHVLPGGADVGQALIEAPGVQMIAFTGSTAVGRRIGDAGRQASEEGCIGTGW